MGTTMNELLLESCSVVSSMFSAILAQRLKRMSKRKERRKRRWWVKKCAERNPASHNSIDLEIRNSYPGKYKNSLRMSDDQFEYLLERVSPLITKMDTIMRRAISPKTKLQVTLRYLATGDSFRSLEYMFQVPKNTISKFIPDTCDAIHKALEEFIRMPTTADEWKNIECEFRNSCDLPGCIGALGGKHIVMRAPPASGSNFYNYENNFNTVLMALADSDYCFLYVDVSAKGRVCEVDLFKNSSMFSAFETNRFEMPANSVIVGNNAFPLKTYLMIPYSRRNMSREEKIYNFRLSRAQRVVENTFGILVSKFRVLRKPISLKLESVDKVVLACCSLHNWQVKTNLTYISEGLVDHEDEDHVVVPGSWRRIDVTGLRNLQPTLHRNPQRQAQQIRDKYRDHFSKEWSLPWQSSLFSDIPDGEQ